MSSPSSNTGSLWPRRNPNLSKWNFLFDEQCEKWISFEPKLDLTVYPCYICKTMFSSKNSLLDHVNRRIVILKYNCPQCKEVIITYNSCAFLLHARQHFLLKGGEINLTELEICTLPLGLAGFSRQPNIPVLYDTDDDSVEPTVYINSQFYHPDINDKGKEIVSLHPEDLTFVQPDGKKLALRQISNTTPKCQFVDSQEHNILKELYELLEENNIINFENPVPTETEVEIKQEAEDDIFTIPVISKIESLSHKIDDRTKCPECKKVVNIKMALHFLGSNLPLDPSLKCSICRFNAPTQCSLEAHIRIHSSQEPLVCPECGKTFDNMDSFRQHLDDVCFHLAKQVKFRCSGKRCGKLFSLQAKYMAHFKTHLKFLNQCITCSQYFTCNQYFTDEYELQNHLKQNVGCQIRRSFACTVCGIMPDGATASYKQHIIWHMDDRSRYIYVYVCRYCRSCFRSTSTFALHLLRCSKLTRKAEHPKKYELINCTNCGFRIVYREHDVVKECRKCHLFNCMPSYPKLYNDTREKELQDTVVDTYEKDPLSLSDEGTDKESETNEPELCILCDQIIESDARISHLESCKYSNPIIVMQKIQPEETVLLKKLPRVMSSGSDDSIESLHDSDSLKSSSSSGKSDDNTKKRRKKLPLTFRNKKSNTNGASYDVEDLQIDKPTPFNGTYSCKLCSFSDTVREAFHEHILKHRDCSIAYQCMECGECFIVKPTLEKHLRHFHFIKDINRYFSENDCFDKEAVTKLEQSVNGVSVKPDCKLEKNQCRVCLVKFEDLLELNKHFRVHGMAFLMSNSK